jgi:predicted permease
MLQNYLKTTLRSMMRSKMYTFLNVSGFGLGLACCLTIMLWVGWQWSFNRFNTNLDSIYFLYRNEFQSASIITRSAQCGPLVSVLKSEYPDIRAVAQIMSSEDALSATVDGKLRAFRDKGMYANMDVFTIFSFPFVGGGGTPTSLQPSSILLSESFAQKMFGTNAAIGKTLTLNGEQVYTVSGVYKDIPKNSSVRGEYVLPIEDYMAKNPWTKQWGNNGFRVYIQTATPASPEFTKALNDKLEPLRRKKINDPQDKDYIFAQPLREMYLYNKFENGVQNGGRIEMVRLFVVIAGLVMLIACVNFMNLATARATRRGKEIGIRKVVGASRVALIGQVVSESILTALLSLPLAMLLVELVLPSLRAMTKAEIFIPYTEPLFWSVTLGLVVFAGLVAGLYPAFALSAFNMASVLKGAVKSGRGALVFRRGLVVFEFAIAVAFISATVMVYRQMDFIKHKNLGLNRENIISLSVNTSVERYAAWKRDLKGIPGVVSVGAANSSPLNIGNNTSGLDWRGKYPKELIPVSFLQIDEDFMTTMGMELHSGRGFSSKFASDSSNFILNETAVKAMRLEQPLGETIRWGTNKGVIVGVVKDFHHNSMRSELEPLMLVLESQVPKNIFIRISSTNIASTVDAVRRSFEKFLPEAPFDYTFLDDDFNDLYRTEMMVGRLALYFSLVAVVVCCLGLFGLAAFTAESRTKEIGVRKVLGASAGNIVALLTKDFLLLVGIAIIIAIPLAYWSAGKWLEDFAYRVDISWWVFAVSGALAVGIAFLTVAAQSWRAARANPVVSLRSE